MAETDALKYKTSTTEQSSITNYKPPTRRRLSFRRRKLPTVRLGGKSRKGYFLVRVFRRVKLKSLKLKYKVMVKKLRSYYRSLGQDMIEGSGSADAFQQRLILETSFAVPVMGFFNNFP